MPDVVQSSSRKCCRAYHKSMESDAEKERQRDTKMKGNTKRLHISATV